MVDSEQTSIVIWQTKLAKIKWRCWSIGLHFSLRRVRYLNKILNLNLFLFLFIFILFNTLLLNLILYNK